MHYFLSVGIDLVSAFIVLLPILCLFLYLRDCKQTLQFALFMFYLCAVFSLVGIPSIQSLTFDPSCNWIPLVDGVHAPLSYLKNTCLNVLLFLPLGVLLPLFLGDACSMKTAAVWGFGLSLFIELIQLFTLRLTDVDDLITNTLGAILGYFLARPFYAARPALSSGCPGTKRPVHPLALTLIAFLVMFIAQPLISGAIWNVLLESPLWERIR